MAAVWHSGLPQRVLRVGLRLALGDNRQISPTDAGGDEARRKSSRRLDPIRVTSLFTEAQRQLFWRFYRDELADGVNDFWFPGQGGNNVPLGLAEGGGILATAAGEPIYVVDWWLCHFDRRAEPPVFDRRELKWIGSLALTRLL